MSTEINTTEIEVRFLEIDKKALIEKLKKLGGVDKGEKLLDEIIMYGPDLKWKDEEKHMRIRRAGEKVMLSYKQHKDHTIDGTTEIEFSVGDFEKAKLLFEKIGFPPSRIQQKIRHTLELGEVVFDIDTWPKIPTYVELEGPSEQSLKDAAAKAGLDWKDVVIKPPRWVIENKYGIPVTKYKWFTFDRME